MFNGKSILAVVPARGGSKGIKRKNLKEFLGKPLVAMVGEFTQSLDFLDKSVVSTDDQEISDVANKYFLESPFVRPDELSGDQIGDVDVLKHALLASEKHYGITFDIILMLQPTAPLRKKEDVVAVLTKITKGKWDSVWTVSKSDPKHHPYKQLKILNNDQLSLYDSRGKNIIARQQLDQLYYRNGNAYAFKRNSLLNTDTVLCTNTSYIISNSMSANIDTEGDILWAEFLAKDLGQAI